MKLRIVALLVSIALAVAGGVIVVNYVRGADARAAAGAELTDVLVVSVETPSGSSVGQLLLSVEQRSIPVSFLADGAITSLAELGELDPTLVTNATLVVGEQLVRARLTPASTFAGAGGSVAVPDGMQSISVSLDRARALGGRVEAGDTVGIFVTLEATDTHPRQTGLVLDQVLVTAVDGGTTISVDGTVSGTGNTVTVTLALTQADAEKVIYAAEFAQLWLSLQTDKTGASDATAPYSGEGLFG